MAGSDIEDAARLELEAVIDTYVGPGTSMADRAAVVRATEQAAAYLLVRCYGNMMTPEFAARAAVDLCRSITGHVAGIVASMDALRGRASPGWTTNKGD